MGLKGRYPQQIPWKCKKLFNESKMGGEKRKSERSERKNVNLHFGRCVRPSVCVASQQNIRWSSLTVILKPRALSTPITPWMGSGGSVRALYYSRGQPHTMRALWTIGTFSGALIWPLSFGSHPTTSGKWQHLAAVTTTQTIVSVYVHPRYCWRLTGWSFQMDLLNFPGQLLNN